MPSRTPPTAVLEELRREVGFRCPVKDCGRPYLSFHHFDPPWRMEQHHRPEGMIALCVEHAAKADGGAFTDDQLRELKRAGQASAEAIEGEFDWLRREVLAVIGGNFYYRTHNIVQVGDERCVWFKRDDTGNLLLNFWMPTESGERRARVVDNVWLIPPDAADVVCPPRGRSLAVKYGNGDALEIEFIGIADAAALAARYAGRGTERWAESVSFPVTIVEVSQKAPGLDIEFGPQRSRFGTATFGNNFLIDFVSDGAAIQVSRLPMGKGGERFVKRAVRIADVVIDARRPVVENAHFLECHVEGPAIIVPVGSKIVNCNFPRDLDALLWTLPGDKVVGAVVFRNCIFERCTFEAIGFSGDAAFLEALRNDLQGKR